MKPGKSVAIIGTRGYPSYYGGFETAVRKLAPYLVDDGWNVTVFGRKGATKADDPSRDARVGIKATRGIDSKSLSTLTYGLSASLNAFFRKPDVALVMNVANGFWLPLLKMRGISTLVNVDGIEWDRDKWGRFAKQVLRLGAWFTAKFADELVFDAVAIGDRWKQDFGRTGIYIPYGGDEVMASEPFGGRTHRGYVLMVARFVPENSIHEFLEAAQILAMNWDVVLVGSSGYGNSFDQEVAKVVAREPRIEWLGHVSDDTLLFNLWQHAGTYFHGHSVGGTNPALVQAMMCGAPVVARDTIYNREVLGDAGRYVEPNAAAIAREIASVMSDAEIGENLSERAGARAISLYSWKSVCERYSQSLALTARS